MQFLSLGVVHGKRHLGLHNASENSHHRTRELIEELKGKTDRKHDCIFCINK